MAKIRYYKAVLGNIVMFRASRVGSPPNPAKIYRSASFDPISGTVQKWSVRSTGDGAAAIEISRAEYEYLRQCKADRLGPRAAAATPRDSWVFATAVKFPAPIAPTIFDNRPDEARR